MRYSRQTQKLCRPRYLSSYDNLPYLPDNGIAVNDFAPIRPDMTSSQINDANWKTLEDMYSPSPECNMRPVNSNEAKRKLERVKCASTRGGYKYRNKRKTHTRKTHTRKTHTRKRKRRKSIKRKRKN